MVGVDNLIARLDERRPLGGTYTLFSESTQRQAKFAARESVTIRAIIVDPPTSAEMTESVDKEIVRPIDPVVALEAMKKTSMSNTFNKI